jgi:hypothetical protein
VLATKATATTTVSQGIANQYEAAFGLHPELVVNATAYHSLSPRPTSRPIRLVHSGVATPSRQLEVLIDAVTATSALVTLDFYVLGRGTDYYESLVRRASSNGRIMFRDPVPYDRLVSTLNTYDVGVHVIPPTSFNQRWALPNKFFDFVQARLGVLIGPSPAMTGYVERYGFGAVTAGFSATDLTAVLNELDPLIVDKWKRASDRAARVLTAESQAETWRRLVLGILTHRN